MSYTQFFAAANGDSVSEEFVIYANDRDEIDSQKVREMVRYLAKSATQRMRPINLWRVCHNHLDTNQKCYCESELVSQINP